MNPVRLPKEQKERVVNELRSFMEAEWSYQAGHLAAEQLLDVILKELTPIIYNQAIGDARHLLTEHMARIEDDLYSLERPIMTSRTK
jgi:uncharacterized protein (DUF2164 family)